MLLTTPSLKFAASLAPIMPAAHFFHLSGPAAGPRDSELFVLHFGPASLFLCVLCQWVLGGDVIRVPCGTYLKFGSIIVTLRRNSSGDFGGHFMTEFPKMAPDTFHPTCPSAMCLCCFLQQEVESIS